MAHVNKPTEIFVFSQQYALFASSLIDKFSIIRTLHHLTDSVNIISFSAQYTHHCKITAFIRKKS